MKEVRMDSATLSNGYHADYVNGIVRVYSKTDMFLCSMKCDEDDWKKVAEALMYGYFCGWSRAHAVLVDRAKNAFDIDMEDVFGTLSGKR